MATNVLVLERRLGDELVNHGSTTHTIIAVDQTTPLMEMMRKIKASVAYPHEKIELLTIAAHGYAEEDTHGKTHDGFGMQLCREDLDMNTVSSFRALDGYFKNRDLGIALLGCGVAEQKTIRTSAGVKTGFGQRLCRAICMGASVGVMASSSVQHITETTFKQRFGARVDLIKSIDAGAWEGDVWLFKPDGTQRKIRPS